MKPRTGLSRNVSSIFDGAPVPNPTAASNPAASGSSLSSAGQDLNKTSLKTRYGDVAQSLGHKLFTPPAGVSDSRQKTATIMMFVLLVVFLAVIYYVFISSPAAKPVVAAVPAKVEVVPVAVKEEAILWKTPDAYPLNMFDPMALSSSAETVIIPDSNIPVAISLAVKGIVFSEDKPSAIINGEVVYEGQTIDGATVTKINRKNVQFLADSKTWTQEVQR